jgi:hypothetical protein
VGVVDSDPAVQGRRLFGHLVQSPAEILNLRAEVILISSLGHAGEIRDHLQSLAYRGPEVFSVELSPEM